MPMTSKQMVKLLQKNGFVEASGGKGSYRRFTNPKTGKTTEIPYHSKDLGKGLEHAILKQARLNK